MVQHLFFDTTEFSIEVPIEYFNFDITGNCFGLVISTKKKKHLDK